MPSERHDDSTREMYRTALETRNLEIKLFWQRSNYFLVLNTAIAVGYFTRDADDFDAFALALIGVVVAYLWLRVNLGSKFWQSRWERRLHIVEEQLESGLELFSADEATIRSDVRESLSYHSDRDWLTMQLTRLHNWGVMRKPSVSKSMTALSALFVLVWTAAMIRSGVCALR
jgi:hypothetical protein